MKILIRSLLFTIVFALLVLPHTASLQKAEWKRTIEYEKGINVIKNPKKPLYAEIEFKVKEDLVIGSADDENSRFFEWLSLDVDESGNIYVLDRGSHRIQKFDKEGRFMMTMGRMGQGPGEFSSPDHITLDEEKNIYVKDGTKAHIFDKEGQFVRSFLIPLNSHNFKITKEGRFLGERLDIRPPDELSEDVVLMNENLTVLEEIAGYPSIRMDSMFNRKDRFAILVPELCFCPSIKDYAVYGFPSEYKLYEVDSSGRVTKIIEKDEPAEKVSGKEKTRIIDELMDQIKSRSSSKQEPREELKKRVLISKFRPFFDEILLDEKGNIYAKKAGSYLDEDEGHEYDFFNSDGQYLYRIQIPKEIKNIKVIKKGCVFSTLYYREAGYFQVKRYRIENWSQLQEKIH